MSATQPADQAIIMHQYGPPTVLIYAGVPRPPLERGEIRIRSIASAVNHIGLEIRAASWTVLKLQPFSGVV
jgi:NADPH2:quinone reductase